MTDDSLLPPDDGDDDIPEVDADEVAGSDEPPEVREDLFGSPAPAVLRAPIHGLPVRMNIVCPQCHADMYFQYTDPTEDPNDPVVVEHHMRMLLFFHECPGPAGRHPYPTKSESGLPWAC